MFMRGSPGRLRLAHLAGDVYQPAHRLDRFVEARLLVALEVELDDALDAAAADHHRHPNIEVLDAVLAGQPGGARQHSLLVAPTGPAPPDRRARRRIEPRAGLQEIDDLGAAVAGALQDLVDLLPAPPA